MAIPNNAPNDSGRKSLAAHVWSTRRAVSRGTDKPKKDFWDIADIIGKFLIALAGVYIGWQAQIFVTTQNTGKDYLQIALGILEQKDGPEELKKNPGLRKWAVELLNHYSQVKLDSGTSNDLINGETNIPTTRELENFLGPKGLSIAQAKSAGVLSADSRFFSTMWPGKIMEIDDLHRNTVQYFQIGFEPRPLVYSPDERYVVAYRNDPPTFTICELSGEKREGRSTPVYVPSGIAAITFSGNAVIVVTDPNGKQMKYDVTGREVQ
jgi:hypothetical protein